MLRPSEGVETKAVSSEKVIDENFRRPINFKNPHLVGYQAKKRRQDCPATAKRGKHGPRKCWSNLLQIAILLKKGKVVGEPELNQDENAGKNLPSFGKDPCGWQQRKVSEWR